MFRVEWIQSALNDLANYWTKADSSMRKAITAASHQIDQRLSINPYQEGESRSGRQRIVFTSPLAVTYQIEADGQTVSVLQVRLFRRRKA